MLTSNEKTIKLWKISHKTIKRSEKFASRKYIKEENLQLPKLKLVDQGLCPTLKRTYANLHGYHINSVSVSPNGENFLSSDDLGVYLWDLETEDKTFLTVDIKPEKIDELNEVITKSCFSPVFDYNIAYSTCKGVIKLLDLRERVNCTNSGVSFLDQNAKKNQNFLTEIINSVSDLKFTNDGTKLISRDFLNTKVWDLKMPKNPLNVTTIYEPLKSRLCDYYENDCIFDKFDLSVSNDSKQYMTGIFDNRFHICDIEGNSNLQFELNFKKKTIFRNINKNFYE